MSFTSRDPRIRRAVAYLTRPEHREILLGTHVHVDGDGLGTALLLRRALRQRGGQATVVLQEPVPPRYGMLPDLDEIERLDRTGGPRACDLLVVCDCGDLRLLGELPELLQPGFKILNVDHHRSNRLFGDVNCLVTEAAAATEVAYRMAEALGVELDSEMAMSAYVGIVLDTGNFSLRSTTPQAHTIAAELLTYDIDPASIYRQLFRGKHIGYMRLAAEFMQSLQQTPCGRLAWGTITRAQLHANGVQLHETDDLIDVPRALHGVQLSLVLRETDGGRATRLSLRSEGEVDVDRFLQELGGGGHRRSAGCVLRRPLREVEEELVPSLLELLDRPREMDDD